MFVVIGTTTVDLFVSGLEQIPALGGDEFTTDNLAFCDEPLTIRLGGNGANSAYVLSRLGAETMLCSAIGRDMFGNMVHAWLTSANVDTADLVHSDMEATSTTVIIDQSHNRLSFHHKGASRTFNIVDAPQGLFERPDILLISGYPLLHGWRPDGIIQALTKARRANVTTALDIGPAIGQPAALPELVAFLPNVDYLLCNEHELAVCTGTDDLEDGLTRLLDAGARCLVVKRGRYGAIVRQGSNSKALAVPGFTVEARFSVGAGDSFNAGFLFGIKQSWDLAHATRFANAVAALVVTAAQGVLGCPTLAQVEKLLNQESTP